MRLRFLGWILGLTVLTMVYAPVAKAEGRTEGRNAPTERIDRSSESLIINPDYIPPIKNETKVETIIEEVPVTPSINEPTTNKEEVSNEPVLVINASPIEQIPSKSEVIDTTEESLNPVIDPVIDPTAIDNPVTTLPDEIKVGNIKTEEVDPILTPPSPEVYSQPIIITNDGKDDAASDAANANSIVVPTEPQANTPVKTEVAPAADSMPSTETVPPIPEVKPSPITTEESAKPDKDKDEVGLVFSFNQSEPLYEKKDEPIPTPIVEIKPSPSPITTDTTATATTASTASTATDISDQVNTANLFVGDSLSLVAKAVGAAEGTRTPDGGFTKHYRKHIDPGNQVVNQGTYSYQHEAKSAEEADILQAARLKKQTVILEKIASEYGFKMTLVELLNGIDLANQAPKAALDDGGYVDHLNETRKLGLSEEEAIGIARSKAFVNPKTNKLDAPGLGNNAEVVRADQDRRIGMIAKAIAANPDLVARALDTNSITAEAKPSVTATVAKAEIVPQAKAKEDTSAKSKVTPSNEGIELKTGLGEILSQQMLGMFENKDAPKASKDLADETIGIQNLFGFKISISPTGM
jgi:hypothetical protein